MVFIDGWVPKACCASLDTVSDPKGWRKGDTTLVVIQFCIMVATLARVAILAYRLDDDSEIRES